MTHAHSDVKKRVVIVGAGNIGLMIATFLSSTVEYDVTVVDQSEESLKKLSIQVPAVKTACVDASHDESLAAVLKGCYAVLNACPFHMSKLIAKLAKQEQVHYFDLTEDVDSTHYIQHLAEGAKSVFMPQCGLAPGFISIVAQDLVNGFDQAKDVHMRVGALPQFPSNGLKYNLTWSTDGLINEYINPCEAIVNGDLREVSPLEELEHFSLDGDQYEAFNTSGGLGTLCTSLAGHVENLNYRTVRYPGHRDIMKLLLQDLKFANKPNDLKALLEEAVPVTLQDVVLVFVNVSGIKNGHFVQENFARKIYSQEVGGTHRSAIQVTTAAGICAALDLMAEGKLAETGFVRQEQIKLSDFLKNRFGRYYGAGQELGLEHKLPDVA